MYKAKSVAEFFNSARELQSSTFVGMYKYFELLASFNV